MSTLVWFRNDLRTHDHAALAEAAAAGDVVACYCVSIAQWRSHDMGDWRLAFQLRTLTEHAKQLEKLGIPLKVLDTPWFSDIPDTLAEFCLAHDISAVHFIDEYPLNERLRDTAVVTKLHRHNINVQRHLGDTIVAPGTLLTGKQTPYTVFSPFYKNWRAALETDLHGSVPVRRQSSSLPVTDNLPQAWDNVPIDTGAGFWPAGEQVAQATLDEFAGTAMARYQQDRDLPAVPGTSKLSAHLAVGSISPSSCARAALQVMHQPGGETGGEHWLREIAWRDFYRHIVAQFDHVSRGIAFRQEKQHLPWRYAPQDLLAWQQGNTGYPLVDAAMRQLNTCGWMHNRLRMVVAMFLSKHLLIDWHAGERYFMQKLVDGDFASNNGGWQWSASTGTDAAPYFRIFNPATQGERFDAKGDFTRAFVPELKNIAPKYLFHPERMPPPNYPAPIVDHGAARERALAFFKANL